SSTTPSSATTVAGCGATPATATGGLAAEPPADAGNRFEPLWEAVSTLTVPLMLVRGMAAGSVVSDDAEKELLARWPDARVEHVEGAGHSVQGDRPVELAALIHSFIP